MLLGEPLESCITFPERGS